jgi:hypothetical protein
LQAFHAVLIYRLSFLLSLAVVAVVQPTAVVVVVQVVIAHHRAL